MLREDASEQSASTTTEWNKPCCILRLPESIRAQSERESSAPWDLTEEGVKELLSRGFRRPGGEAPTPTDPKGSVKFWIKDGVVNKYEYKVQASMSVNGNDITIDRTTTVEIRDIGSTKVEVPEEAKKKAS